MMKPRPSSIIGDNGIGVFGVGKEKAPQKTTQKATQKTTQKTVRNIGKTAQLILDMMIADPTTTREQFAVAAGVTSDAIKWQLKKLTALGLISRIGGDKGGLWKVIANPRR